MRRPRPLAVVAALCACLVLAAPLCGCGAKKKKPGATVAERIKKAKADKTPGGPARELVKVARSQFKNGDRSGAIKTLAEAKAAVPEDADAVIFAPRLVDVAGLYAELAERKPAKESLEAATLLVKRLEDPVTRAQLLARIGVVYGAKTGGLGDTSTAKKRLEEAASAGAAAFRVVIRSRTHHHRTGAVPRRAAKGREGPRRDFFFALDVMLLHVFVALGYWA
jgi:hypothetical protein